jgi:predicted membrane-bound mannosyltransferase
MQLFLTDPATLLAVAAYLIVAALLIRSGYRDYSAAWASVPFSLLWPISLPLTVVLGLLGVWDDDWDLTE